jgi:hypothetical protein
MQREPFGSYSYFLNVEHLERKELAPFLGLRAQRAFFKSLFFRYLLNWAVVHVIFSLLFGSYTCTQWVLNR